MVFAFGATADASQLVKQIRGDSAKSQKQITLSGEKIFWVRATLIAELHQRMTSIQKHYIRSSFSEGVTKLRISILQTAKKPERIFQHGRYFGIPGNTKLQKECIERILATQKVQELLASRPSPIWSDLEQMAAMPKGSLGW